MQAGSMLFVIADGASARFIGRIRPGAPLAEYSDLHMTADPVEAERDRAPRIQDSVGSRRHKIERRLTAREAAEQRFLGLVADRLAATVQKDRYDSFVLCAPPRALGTLRQALPASLNTKVAHSIDKDLTKEPLREFQERIRELAV